jgi:hypothetical protein
MSLVADMLPVGRTNPSTCQKIKYSNRSDTPVGCQNSDMASDQRFQAAGWYWLIRGRRSSPECGGYSGVCNTPRRG